MEITFFLAAGMLAELVLALVRPLHGAVRGLVCWSVAAVVLVMSCGVYFSGVGSLEIDLPGVIGCVGGAGCIVLLAALIELFSPSRRSRQKPEQQLSRSERSLNIVLSIAAGILCAASLALTLAGERDIGAVLMIPPSAAAIRQTLWFMRASGSEQPGSRRDDLTKRISGEKYRL